MRVSKKGPEPVKTPSTQTVVSKYHSLLKRNKASWKIVDFRYGAANVLTEAGVFCSQMQEHSPNLIQTWQKEARASLKRHSHWANLKQFEHNK